MTEVCLLPGPVSLSATVRAAMQQPPLYHRGADFLTLFDSVREQLSALVGGRDVALFLGSGTLANEVVAATLAAPCCSSGPCGLDDSNQKTNRPSHKGLGYSGSHGLILDNGEFGRRLVAQAERFELHPRVLTWPWGTPWDLNAVATVLNDAPPGSWVWGVHHESSTGMLNDLPGLIRVARQRGIRVCVDAVSSLGGQSLDLSEVFLASGTSGKALGACSGIAIVFANRVEINQLDLTHVPTYLDLAATLAYAGPRFTFPSSLLQTLAAALTEYATPAQTQVRFEQYASLGRYVRGELIRLGHRPLADEPHASPTITTFAVPAGWTSEAFVEFCRRGGFLIGGQSEYLSERRLVQIATMGAATREECTAFLQHLASLSWHSPPSGS